MTYKLVALLWILAAPAWGAISFINSASAESSGNVTTLDVTVPSHAADDLIACWTTSDGGGETHTPSDNVSPNLTWTSLTAVDADVATASEATGRLHWAIATSNSASGFTFTFTCGNSQTLIAGCAILRGVDTTTPIGVSNATTGATDTPTGSQTTGTTSGSWALAGMVIDRAVWTDGNGVPSNTTVIFDIENDSTSPGSKHAGTFSYDTSGDTDSESYTWPAATSGDEWATGIYEVKQAGGAPSEEMMFIGP